VTLLRHADSSWFFPQRTPTAKLPPVSTGTAFRFWVIPIRHLQQWIERNILLELASAPFSKEDATLLPEAGACVDCPKRTGFNTVLFGDMGGQQDSCSDPKCFNAKVEAHVAKAVAAKPKLVQISTAYGVPKEGSAAIPRNKYVLLRQDKPQKKEQRDWPEYKTCQSTTEARPATGQVLSPRRCTRPV
jgi:ParB family chromosome partitioning protein